MNIRDSLIDISKNIVKYDGGSKYFNIMYSFSKGNNVLLYQGTKFMCNSYDDNRFNDIIVCVGEKFGLISRDMNFILDPRYEFIKFCDNDCEKCIVKSRDSDGNLFARVYDIKNKYFLDSSECDIVTEIKSGNFVKCNMKTGIYGFLHK